MLYVDTSAILVSYLPDDDRAATSEQIMSEWDNLATSQLGILEAQRNLLVRLGEGLLLETRRAEFESDIEQNFHVVELDSTIWEEATLVALRTRLPSLDSLHIAAALRLGPDTALLTFDRQQAEAAQQMGLSTYGADI